jgi:hypothetical protein
MPGAEIRTRAILFGRDGLLGRPTSRSSAALPFKFRIGNSKQPIIETSLRLASKPKTL